VRHRVRLLSDVDTRSCWQLAEQASDASPHAMQRLLGEAVWNADWVRDSALVTFLRLPRHSRREHTATVSDGRAATLRAPDSGYVIKRDRQDAGLRGWINAQRRHAVGR
jgi:hypothetical protein